MRALQMQAIKKAGQIRARLKLNMFEPVNIYDVCEAMDVTVRFVDVSMEGMYVVTSDSANPDILISNLRPFARRVYTCAHELGHHVFGHGTRIDGLSEDGSAKAVYDNDEFLVDTFAGAFLMPLAGVEAAFGGRGWNLRSAEALQFYTVASFFGTSYKSLITHCRVNGLISDSESMYLNKETPAKILEHLIGPVSSRAHFKIIDQYAKTPVIDLEVGSFIFLPEDTEIEGNHLSAYKDIPGFKVFVANRSGITRAVNTKNAHFIRIQNAGYSGLAEYRHLED